MCRIRGEGSFVKNSEGGEAATHEGRKSPKYIRHLRKIYGLLREANGETSLLTHHIDIYNYINVEKRTFIAASEANFVTEYSYAFIEKTM